MFAIYPWLHGSISGGLGALIMVAAIMIGRNVGLDLAGPKEKVLYIVMGVLAGSFFYGYVKFDPWQCLCVGAFWLHLPTAMRKGFNQYIESLVDKRIKEREEKPIKEREENRKESLGNDNVDL